MLRGAVFVLLGLSLLDVSVSRSRAPRSGVVAIDVSDSVATADLGRDPRFEALARWPPDTPAVLFASSPVRSTLRSFLDGRLADLPATDATHLERGLLSASALLDAGGHLVLVTDGRATEGSWRDAVADLGARGARVDVVAAPAPRELWIDGVRAPDRVRVGEWFPVEVDLASTAPAPVTVAVSISGTTWGEVRAVVPAASDGMPGRARVDMRDRRERRGRARVELAARALDPAGASGAPGNDRAVRWVEVGGGRTVVWVDTAGSGPPFDPGRLGATIVPASPPVDDTRLAGVDVVVLHDVPAGPRAMTRASQGALARYVREGGGLVTFGASGFYGPGGYAGAPLEGVLPVRCRPRDRGSRLLVVLLDRSGSMGEEGKLARATAAIESLARALGPGDRLALLTFAEEPAWILEGFEPDDGDVAAVRRALEAVEARGGTRLAPAVEAGWRALSEETGERDLFVVTDGRAEGDFREQGRRLDRAGIRVSVFLTGRDADERVAAELTRDGRNGRVVRDVGARFLEELLRGQWASADLARGPAGVRPVEGGPLADAVGAAGGSPVSLLARCTERAGASTSARTERGGDPLVASHRAGAGRVVSVMVPVEPATFAADPGFVRAAIDLAAGPFAAWIRRVERTEDGLRVQVRAPERTPVDEPLRLERGGRVTVARALGAGRFEALVEGEGGEGALVLLDASGRMLDRRAVPGPAAEDRGYGPDAVVLAELARLGGGERLPAAPDPAEPAGARRGAFSGGWLLLAALVLLLLERALARLGAR